MASVLFFFILNPLRVHSQRRLQWLLDGWLDDLVSAFYLLIEQVTFIVHSAMVYTSQPRYPPFNCGPPDEKYLYFVLDLMHYLD